jgi:hypothetical protein
MKVPILDLAAEQAEIGAELRAALERVFVCSRRSATPTSRRPTASNSTTKCSA